MGFIPQQKLLERDFGKERSRNLNMEWKNKMFYREK
jgi:hypothetical protein